MKQETLSEQNRQYSGTQGVSADCANLGFLPAFQDLETGETHLAVNSDGSISPIHVLYGLPDEWVLERDLQHRVISVKESIVAGFVRNGRFYSREELANMPFDS